uniref:Amino acid transporter transmembrane domain-containing protein n=1 Tax=Kalanchoe fedtschenkoi TaxID=63787 RepID=A0A7N0UIC0_KALFE
MAEVHEVNHASCPPSPHHSPSSPRRRIFTPNFLTPIGSPVRKALRLTKLDPQDAWLPITESRNGNAAYAAFHTLCSGIGVQALVLPLSFTVLGWTCGIIGLTFIFSWQLYTLWVLVQLHESTETGKRCSRYLQLSEVAFGRRLGKLLALIPIFNLSAGTCTALIIIGGSTSKQLFNIICGEACKVKPLTPVEWYLVFTTVAVTLSQLPNMNSIAGVSLIGAVTAVGYCMIIWVVSALKGKIAGVSYTPVHYSTAIDGVFNVFNALGIIAFAFRGHNLVLEIQGTMPSTEKHPSHVPMWRGVKLAYVLVALSLFPLAIVGYWAYGNMIPVYGSLLEAFYYYHSMDVSRIVLGLISVFVVVNAASSFQIYGMPSFDQMESGYISIKKKPCPWWVRALFRIVFGYMCFFGAVAIPFVGSVSGLIGGLSLPVTLVYPCFMWLAIKKPAKLSSIWWLNWFLGTLGVFLTVATVAGGVYSVLHTGLKADFFHPQ